MILKNDNIIRVTKLLNVTQINSKRTTVVLNKVNISVHMGGKHNSLKVIVIYRKEPTKKYIKGKTCREAAQQELIELKNCFWMGNKQIHLFVDIARHILCIHIKILTARRNKSDACLKKMASWFSVMQRSYSNKKTNDAEPWSIFNFTKANEPQTFTSCCSSIFYHCWQSA